MNIVERAQVITINFPRDEVRSRADQVLLRVGEELVGELVAGEDVAWLVAAMLTRITVNGSGPRVFVRTMDDAVKLKDGLG